MKFLSSAATLVVVSAAAVLIGGTASFAAATSYSAFDQSVKSDLATLKVPSIGLGQLTVTEVAQLSDVLNGSRKAPFKTAWSEFVIGEALAPATVDLNSADGQKMVSDLKAKLAALNLTYPTKPLTGPQVQALLGVLGNAPSSSKHEAKVIGFVLTAINHPAKAAATPSPIIGMEADLDAKVTALGLNAPKAGTMIYDQVGQLEAIFAGSGQAADQKAAVMKVLNLA